MNNETTPIAVLCQGTTISVSVDLRFPVWVSDDIYRVLNRYGGSSVHGVEISHTPICRVYHTELDYPGCAIDVMKAAAFYNHKLGCETEGYDPPMVDFRPDYIKETV